MKKYCLLALALLSIRCHTADKVEKRLDVLVVGNSITNHAALPEVGWFHDWGMAASAPEKDFCGLLSQRHNVTKASGYTWEKIYGQDNCTTASQKPIDVLVIQLGDNVLPDDFEKFKSQLPSLISCYAQSKTHVIIVGNFWEYDKMDDFKKAYCAKQHYYYADLDPIRDNPDYCAKEYENFFVSIHPNDAGMRFIADQILKQINLSEHTSQRGISVR
jgi:hypothetical protein